MRFLKIQLTPLIRSILSFLCQILPFKPQSKHPLLDQDQFQQILECLPLGIAVMYPDGSYDYLNEKAKTILGKAETPGISAKELPRVHNLYRAGTGELYPIEELPIVRAFQGQTIHTDDMEIHLDDRIVSIDVQASPVRNTQGEIFCAIATFQDISDRKRTEAALREQEAQFRRIAESVPGMLFRYIMQADGHAKFSYISPRCREIFEVEPEEAIQDAMALWATVHPDDIPAVQAYLSAAIDTLQPTFVELRITTASGKTKWLQAPGRPARFPNGDVFWDGIAVDVTTQKQAAKLIEQYNHTLERQVQERTMALMQEIRDREQAEAALSKSEAQLRAIVQAIPDLIFCTDIDGVFLGYSRTNQFRDLVPPNMDPLGKSFSEILPPEIVERHLYHIQQALRTGKLQTYEQQLWVHDRWQYEEVRVMPTEDDRMVFIIRDISDRKSAEAALQHAKEEAEAANRAKSTFLASMSHELRTPLNAILGFAKMMSRHPETTADQQRYLQIINQSGEHLLSLINSVLDLSKIEAGRMELLESSFNLIEFVETVTAMLHERATHKGVQLHREIAPDLPPFAIADAGKMRQILINLIGNAIKFTDRGSITLRVLRTELDHLVFEIEDTGIGIAPDDLDRVFDAFAQADTRKTFTEGTGLGLPLCRKFVELMGGSLSVRSVLGQGSCFTVEIPVQFEECCSVLDPQPGQHIVGLHPGQPSYRILVVDDQLENRALLIDLLGSIGFSLQEATNGQEALDRCQTWQPDAILMDLRMPVMTGLEATQMIRKQEQFTHRHTRIIALSATAFEDDRRAAIAAGCDAFLSKPFRDRDLLQLLTLQIGATYLMHDRPPEPLPLLNADLIQSLPEQWREQLYQVTLSCDEARILALLEEFPPQQQLLKSILQKLAQQFDFERILLLLDRGYTD